MQIDRLSTEEISARAAELMDLLQPIGETPTKLYALIDHSFLYPGDIFKRWPATQPPHFNLMQHIPGAADAHSPLLLELPSDTACCEPAVVTLLERCNGLSMLAFIGSAATHALLAAHLSAFTEVKLPPDGEPYVWRIADTRITSVLPQLLSTEQKATLLHPVKQWAYLDRASNWSTISNGEATPTVLPSQLTARPLHLTQEQVDAFLRACMPDNLLSQLVQDFPQLAQQRPSEQYRQVEEWVTEAMIRGGGEAPPGECLAHCATRLSA